MAAKPFSDRLVPELSNIPLDNGETSFMAEVTMLVSETPCRGQVSVLVDGKVELTVGFESVQGNAESVILQGVLLTGPGQNLDIEVDCQKSVMVTGKLHVEGSGPLKIRRFEQKDAVLVDRDPNKCSVKGCKTAAIGGRILCSKHAFPGEIVKSDRRRAIEATKAKRAKVSEANGR